MKPALSIARSSALWSFCALICAVGPAAADPAPNRAPSDALAKLTFAPGAAALPAPDATDLGAALAWASAHPDGLVVVDGHADPATPPAATARLALARAKAVRARLISAGANPDQIVIAAFSATPRDQSVVVWGSVTVASR
jgi:outer membrane protein OmpA-like peptidoglycan-associated protein